MEKHTLHHETSEVLKAINQAISPLSTQQKPLSLIEKDILMQHIRTLYQLVNRIEVDDVDEPATVPEDNANETTCSENPETPIAPEETAAEMQEPFPDEATQPEPPIGEPPATQDMISPIIQEELPVAREETKTAPDLFSEMPAVSAKPASLLPVGLKKAIGINDKFFFLNELFDGSLNDYNKTIEELDVQKTAKEAVEILDKLSVDRNWDNQSDAFTRLQQFVERNIK